MNEEAQRAHDLASLVKRRNLLRVMALVTLLSSFWFQKLVLGVRSTSNPNVGQMTDLQSAAVWAVFMIAMGFVSTKPLRGKSMALPPDKLDKGLSFCLFALGGSLLIFTLGIIPRLWRLSVY